MVVRHQPRATEQRRDKSDTHTHTHARLHENLDRSRQPKSRQSPNSLRLRTFSSTAPVLFTCNVLGMQLPRPPQAHMDMSTRDALCPSACFCLALPQCHFYMHVFWSLYFSCSALHFDSHPTTFRLVRDGMRCARQRLMELLNGTRDN